MLCLFISPCPQALVIFNSELCTELNGFLRKEYRGCPTEKWKAKLAASGRSWWSPWGVKGSASTKEDTRLKSGTFWPTGRSHLTSCNEQRPLQAVLSSWTVTAWQLAYPTCVTSRARLGSTHVWYALWKGLLCPFLHGLTEPVRSAAALLACVCHSSSVVGAKLSMSCVYKGGDRQCQRKDGGLSP